MKTCTKCKLPKPDNQFYTKNDRLSGSSYCKSCFNEYCIKRWIQKKIDAINYKGGKCLDCKKTLQELHYSVFEFHHRDPKKKDYMWTKLRLRAQKTINKELDKCDLLCANCHRIRHAE